MIHPDKLGTAELLYRSAERMGMQPAWVTNDGMFVIAAGGGEHYVNAARSVLNSHVSVSLAANKYLTRLILERHKLPNIPFARPSAYDQAQAFLQEHGTIIVKPVRGCGSHDIHIVSSMDQIASLDIKKYIFEKYIVGKEMRYLVLSGKVIGVHQSEYGTSVEEDRALQRISYPKNKWDPLQAAMSVQIAAILGLQFAAVDYLIDSNGDFHILEVNSVPGLKWFHAPTSGPPIDVAHMFLEAMVDQINGQAAVGAH